MVQRLGIPTASIIGSGFLKQAGVISKGLGVPLAMGVYPGAPMVDSEEALRRKVEEVLAPGLLRSLTESGVADEADERELNPGDIAFTGTFDDIQEHFHRSLWSDGLPVVPPTRERVDAFLALVDRDPHEVLRVVPQESREATILSIA